MEDIADGVSVEARHVSAAQLAAQGFRCAQSHALQYVVVNRSWESLALRLDFSRSTNISFLVTNDTTVTKSLPIVEIHVGPLQMQSAVSVIRCGTERAYIHVDYTVMHRFTPGPEQIEQARSTLDAAVGKAIDASHEVYGHLKMSVLGGTASLCAGINRVSRCIGVPFIDAHFPPTPRALTHGNTEADAWKLVTWAHLGDVVDASWWCLVDENKASHSQSPRWIYHGLPGQETWVCAVDALRLHRVDWCSRWFGDRLVRKLRKTTQRVCERSTVAVSLCVNGSEWRSFTMDLFVPVLPSVNGGMQDEATTSVGLLSAWPDNGELTSVLLQKAYAKRRGCYGAIGAVPTRAILQELTGRPIVEVLRVDAMALNSGTTTRLIERLRRVLETSLRSSVGTTVMVSFEQVDAHQCGFQVVAAINTESRITLRDPVNILKPAVLARLQATLQDADDSSELAVPVDIFLRLQPTVFHILHDHQYAWRRRKLVVVPPTEEDTVMRVVISCGSLQSIVVRGIASTACLSSGPSVTLTVDSIEASGRWSRLDLRNSDASVATDHTSEGATVGTQVAWIAGPGEYIVTLTMANAEAPLSATTKPRLEDSLSLLFKCLDQDMDGLLSEAELVAFLQVHEQLPEASTSTLPDKVAAFLDRFGINHTEPMDSNQPRGLDVEDLLGVYQSMAMCEQRGVTASLEDLMRELIQRDLSTLLPVDPTKETLVLIPTEVVCVVHSDQDDVAVVVLQVDE